MWGGLKTYLFLAIYLFTVFSQAFDYPTDEEMARMGQDPVPITVTEPVVIEPAIPAVAVPLGENADLFGVEDPLETEEFIGPIHLPERLLQHQERSRSNLGSANAFLEMYNNSVNGSVRLSQCGGRDPSMLLENGFIEGDLEQAFIKCYMDYACYHADRSCEEIHRASHICSVDSSIRDSVECQSIANQCSQNCSKARQLCQTTEYNGSYYMQSVSVDIRYNANSCRRPVTTRRTVAANGNAVFATPASDFSQQALRPTLMTINVSTPEPSLSPLQRRTLANFSTGITTAAARVSSFFNRDDEDPVIVEEPAAVIRSQQRPRQRVEPQSPVEGADQSILAAETPQAPRRENSGRRNSYIQPSFSDVVASGGGEVVVAALPVNGSSEVTRTGGPNGGLATSEYANRRNNPTRTVASLAEVEPLINPEAEGIPPEGPNGSAQANLGRTPAPQTTLSGTDRETAALRARDNENDLQEREIKLIDRTDYSGRISLPRGFRWNARLRAVVDQNGKVVSRGSLANGEHGSLSDSEMRNILQMIARNVGSNESSRAQLVRAGLIGHGPNTIFEATSLQACFAQSIDAWWNVDLSDVCGSR